jgi:hypothetical protein
VGSLYFGKRCPIFQTPTLGKPIPHVKAPLGHGFPWERDGQITLKFHMSKGMFSIYQINPRLLEGSWLNHTSLRPSLFWGLGVAFTDA